MSKISRYNSYQLDFFFREEEEEDLMNTESFGKIFQFLILMDLNLMLDL